MTAFPVLEVAIGLAFTYLLLALITTTITEWIARISNSRGEVLVQGVRQLLGEEGKEGTGLTQALFDHPLIKPLAQRDRKGKQRIPSYIPAPLFAKALTDLIEQRQKQTITSESKATDAIPRQLSHALAALSPTIGESTLSESLSGDTKPVEEWYEQHMERVSGWYKRGAQSVVLGIAVVLTLLTNANTVSLAQRLWTDAPLREAVVESAKVRLQQGPPIQTVEYEDPTTPKPTKPIQAESDSANQVLPEEQQLLNEMLGWSGELARLNDAPWLWISTHLLGWTISALAISLGAPFWFDMLNRLMNIRSSGRSPQEAAAAK